MVCVLFKISESLGNVREGVLAGGKDLNSGAFPTGASGGPKGPRSYCSHE